MENRKKDHTYTQNSPLQQQEVTKKDRKKDHTYSKENQFVIIGQEEVVQQTDGAARDEPITIDDTDVNLFSTKPDHSYSVMDKPKVAHREKQENKVPLPYPLKGDHEYVRGKPNNKEIIVSEKDTFLPRLVFPQEFFFGERCQVQKIEIEYRFYKVEIHKTVEAFILRPFS